MGSLVWSTTEANSQGSSQEGWLGPHSPSMHPHSPRGFSGPFQEVLGNPLPCPQWSQHPHQPSSPPPKQSAFSVSACQPAFPSGSCPCGHRQLPSLWEPGPVITYGPLGLPLGLAASLRVCRASWRPGVRPTPLGQEGHHTPLQGDPNTETCPHPLQESLARASRIGGVSLAPVCPGLLGAEKQKGANATDPGLSEIQTSVFLPAT